MTGPREILLVRHPQTVANSEGRHVARGDSPYTELGCRQADIVAEALAEWGPGVVFASPQRRALVPALRSGLSVIVDADLSEFDVGRSEGLTHAEGVAAGTISEGDWFAEDARPHAGGERTGDFAKRVQAAWHRVLASDEDRVALMSHRGVIVTATVAALGLPMASIFAMRLEPATGVLLDMSGGSAVMCGMGVLPGR